MQKIEEVYAFLAADENGEGIITMRMQDGAIMPFISADKSIIEVLRPHAEQLGRMGNKKITLVRFHKRKDVETVIDGTH